jgi:ferredoxin--NADP+ reductase
MSHRPLVLPQTELNIYNKQHPVVVPVIESKIATISYSPNFVRHIVFDVTGTELENRIKAGQSIGVLPPGVDDKGKPHALRLYSVASPSFGEDGNGRHYSTTVKRVIDEHWQTQQLFTGVCSNYLSGLKPGDMVSLTGPCGKRFILPEDPAHFNYIFVATGTGIAPFRGMIMELMRINPKCSITLIFGCAYRTDLLYDAYFRQVAKENPNFNYLISISREDSRPDGTKKYVQYQFVDEATLLNPILNKPETLMYICGLKGMEFGIYQTLAQFGHSDYLLIKPEVNTDPTSWTKEDIRSGIKPSTRMFVETY